MPRSASTPEKRFDAIRAVLVDARREIAAAIETVHPAAAECLPVPELVVPDINGFPAASSALNANLFTVNGGRAAAWVAARSGCPHGSGVAIAVYELCYAWYQLIGAGRSHIESERGWTNYIDRLVEMLPGRIARLIAGPISVQAGGSQGASDPHSS
ncbi:hypothetical protein O7626_02960 [Micromonospora sp. WMMD1102]|uniref:hypothetical protein n=1 Tax=Micromonospora sp. WMMD1102 TaxID=3016105 RepID=UPI0024156CB4|nr:hypothetical protein [Micromonospora sp. WMMD1102]MDG4784900.1 hypothetical protein [Micromonospora sp. WMMD1102]